MLSKHTLTRVIYSLLAALAAIGLVQAVEAAGNIDLVNKWAWSTNAGWINFNSSFGGMTVNPVSGAFDGYAWAENVGWISFKGHGLVPYNVVLHLARLFLSLIRR